MSEKTKVYNPNDGIAGRDGGPYLDIEEAKAREKRSAEREGRAVNENETPRGIGIPEKTQREILDRRYIPGSLKDDEDQDTKIEKHLKEGNVGEVEIEAPNFTTTQPEEEFDFLSEDDDK